MKLQVQVKQGVMLFSTQQTNPFKIDSDTAQVQVFSARFNPSLGGAVYRRSTTNLTDLNAIMEIITTINSNYSSYHPKLAIVATWDSMKPFSQSLNPVVSFNKNIMITPECVHLGSFVIGHNSSILSVCLSLRKFMSKWVKPINWLALYWNTKQGWQSVSEQQSSLS